MKTPITTITWNTITSFLFECMLAVHVLMLYKTMPAAEHVLMVTLFSTMYLIAHLAGLEGVTATFPYLKSICRTQATTRNAFISLFTLQASLYTTGALVGHYAITKGILNRLSGPPFIASIMPLLIIATISEGLRKDSRQLLHALNQHIPVTVVDMAATTIYFIAVWGSPGALTTYKLILLHTLTSTASVLGMAFLHYYWYNQTFPHKDPNSTYTFSHLRGTRWHDRFTLTALNAPKKLFSANFLAPFFAAHAMTQSASMIKVTSDVARIGGAILRSGIGFSASALFIHQPKQHKQLFTFLWQRLVLILAYGITTLCGYLIYLTHAQTAGLPSILTTVFIYITLIDYIFILYEQLFIIRGHIKPITYIRLTEALSIAMSVKLLHHNPIAAIGAIVVIHTVALTSIFTLGSRAFGITPHGGLQYLLSRGKREPFVLFCTVVITITLIATQYR